MLRKWAEKCSLQLNKKLRKGDILGKQNNVCTFNLFLPPDTINLLHILFQLQYTLPKFNMFLNSVLFLSPKTTGVLQFWLIHQNWIVGPWGFLQFGELVEIAWSEIRAGCGSNLNPRRAMASVVATMSGLTRSEIALLKQEIITFCPLLPDEFFETL